MLPLLAQLALAAIVGGSAYNIKKGLGPAKKPAPTPAPKQPFQWWNQAPAKPLPRVTTPPSTAPLPIHPDAPPVIRPANPGATAVSGATTDYSPLIREVAQRYGWNPAFFDALVATESNYNPRAYRAEPRLNDASYGLTQILGSTARELGLQGSPEQLYDPAIALDYAGRYFQSRTKQYPKANWKDPLTAYRVYNTGNPYGNPTAGALDRFQRNYQSAKKRY